MVVFAWQFFDYILLSLEKHDVLMHCQTCLLHGNTYFVIRGIPCSPISKDLFRECTVCAAAAADA